MIEGIASIEEQHNGKWVFMIDCEEDENGSIVAGHVVLSDENRANIVSKLVEYEDNVSLTSIRYVGKIPEGVYILL